MVLPKLTSVLLCFPFLCPRYGFSARLVLAGCFLCYSLFGMLPKVSVKQSVVVHHNQVIHLFLNGVCALMIEHPIFSIMAEFDCRDTFHAVLHL